VIYRIEEIEREHDQSICQTIKSVGAKYGAIAACLGPPDLEVLCVSQQYRKGDGSIYYIASVAGPWRSSKALGMQQALSSAYLKSQGLYGLRDEWIKLHHPR
jgi:hypothetical protein